MMLDFQQKRKIRSLMYNRVTIILLFFVLLIVIHSTWRVYSKKNDSEEARIISQKNVDNLNTRSIELQTKIERLSTQQGIEEEVRSKFNVAKPNENMVIIVQDESSTSEGVKKVGFWDKIKTFFSE
jgi:cell division protein FtsB